MYREYLETESAVTEETHGHLAWHRRGFTGKIPACIQEQERIRQQEFLADATPLPPYKARDVRKPPPDAHHESWDATARWIQHMVEG
jgi:hypothetical protein